MTKHRHLLAAQQLHLNTWISLPIFTGGSLLILPSNTTYVKLTSEESAKCKYNAQKRNNKLIFSSSPGHINSFDWLGAQGWQDLGNLSNLQNTGQNN